jgi:hypothetical protein
MDGGELVMFTLGAISFVAPVALLGLATLPILWWLLRVIPPAPRRVRFPAIRLVMRLVNPEESSAKTPLWLTLLRLALLTLVILGAAHPILNANNKVAEDGPLILIVDDGWASARHWNKRQTSFANLMDQAERQNRAVAVITTAPGNADQTRAMESLLTADAARQVLGALQPKPWPVNRIATISILNELKVDGSPQIIWLSNGLNDKPDGSDVTEFAAALEKIGPVTVLADSAGALPPLLLPPVSERDGLTVAAKRAASSVAASLSVRVRDDDGNVLTRQPLTFAPGESDGKLKLILPAEIRNKVTVIEIENFNSAGSTVLVDERWRRRPVGLISSRKRSASQPLLDNLFYLDKALDPFTEVRVGTMAELFKRDLAMIVLADPGKMTKKQNNQLQRWIKLGGIALRFAGPRLAAEKNPVLPVRLRKGNRELGGALSWSKPAALAAFTENSPFAGLVVPKDVRIHRQVLAQPTVDLPEKTWARLTDGTPLVTAEKRGDGWLVFFHITASPNWSNLPLSGLFVGMLQNLVQLSRGVVGEASERLLKPVQSIDGFGRLTDPRPGALAMKGSEFLSGKAGPQHPPGFYGDETARRAFNLSPSITHLTPLGELGANVTRDSYQETREQDFRGALLIAALFLALLDIIASFALRGFFTFNRATAALLALMITPLFISAVEAQTVVPGISNRANDDRQFAPALNIRIAYVKTGDSQIDNTSRAGLEGLAFIANSRTAAEMGKPIAIDPATNELSYYPMIYWPVTEDAPMIEPATAAKLNRYLKSGGMIFFDTRDNTGGGAGADRLEDISRHLDVPPMTAIPSDHVLTKAYYLLREFPGRWTGGRVWVQQSASQAAERANDGVSSIIVGGHDWAAAWAMDEARKPLYPVVPGGERQREMAYRFGINLMMYVLTGNYKADQVHLPAILERLGQ